MDLLFNVYKIPIFDDENIVEMYSDDGYTL